MGFTTDPAQVEAHLFVRRTGADNINVFQGKWKYTIALDMRGFYDEITPVDAVEKAWQAGQFDGVVPSIVKVPIQEDGYWLVVSEPYHKHPYPVMVAV
jgi:hypothetical protein